MLVARVRETTVFVIELLEKAPGTNSNSSDQKTHCHHSDQNDMPGKHMHVIRLDIGNHAKFRVECQAKGRSQERQLGDDVD